MQPFDSIARLEGVSALDPVIAKVQGKVRGLLPPGPVRDALHGVWLGHPLHPALVLVPIGGFVGAGVLDAVPDAEREADLLVAVGLVGAVPAVLAGYTDWSELHEQQQRTGLVHAATNATAAALYATSLAARATGHRGLGRSLGWLGLGMVTAGGLIGGHLAYRQAAGANHAEHVPHVVGPGWHDLGASADLPDGELVGRQAGTEPLVVLRRGGSAYVLAGSCSHLSGPLADGELVDDDGRPCVRCPWHGSTFRLTDGAVVHGPATAPQPAFDVDVTGGRLRVRLPGAG